MKIKKSRKYDTRHTKIETVANTENTQMTFDITVNIKTI